jgi:DNA polymerase-1
MSNTTVVEVDTMLRLAASEPAKQMPASQSGPPAHGPAGLGHDLEPQRRHLPASGRLATGRGRLVTDQFGLAMKWRDMIRLHTVPRVLAADR